MTTRNLPLCSGLEVVVPGHRGISIDLQHAPAGDARSSVTVQVYSDVDALQPLSNIG